MRTQTADDLAALVKLGADLVAQVATLHARLTVDTPSSEALHGEHLANVRAAMRIWAQALAPTTADLTPLWTQSLEGQLPPLPVVGAPSATIAVLGRVYERLLGLVPAWDASTGSVQLSASPGHARRRSGSYYTPAQLVACVVDAALGPLLSETAAASDPATATLSLRILDPACGSGHFLQVVGDRIATTLALARGLQRPGQRERADVAKHCLYGLDLDPTAVDLCRATLWQWCGFEADCAAALAAHVRWGNALLGLGPRGDLATMGDGIADSAFKAISGDDPTHARQLRRHNALARRDAQLARAVAAMHDPRKAEAVWLANAWCAAFALPKTRDGAVPTNADLACVVRGVAVDDNVHRAVMATAKALRLFHWRLGFPEVFAGASCGFDGVVGNPPYLNQLHTDTAGDRATAELLRACTQGLASGYADTSVAFWARVPDWLRPGGLAGLVVPHSLLVTADAGPLRQHLVRHGHLQGLWVAGQRAFADADVMTCAPIWQRDRAVPSTAATPRPAEILRWSGAECAIALPLQVDRSSLRQAPTWGALAADLLGIPAVPSALAATGSLVQWASATADFRDQYYGLDGFVTDRTDADPWLWAKVVTSGLLDLATCHHGARPTKLLKQTWHAPCVDVVRMRREGALGPWVAQRQVPKVLVATQTPVIEVWVDVVGATLPSVPVLTVVPRDAQDLWAVGAALASPVASAWAANQYAGAALALRALKLSATQLLDIPTPKQTDAPWQQAVRAFQLAHAAASSEDRKQHLRRFGRAAVQCYGLDNATGERVLTWWLQRADLD